MAADAAQGARPPVGMHVPAAPATRVTRLDALPGYRQAQKHLRDAAKAHAVDYALLKAVTATESGFDPRAVSPKGAVGLMQLMPATAERYGVTADKSRSIEDKLTDPRTNIRAGARYLSYLIKLFPGRIDLAVAAYNAGEGAVKRSSNQIPNYKETRDYVATVLGLYAAFKGDASVPVAKAFKSNKLPKAGTAVAAEAGNAASPFVKSLKPTLDYSKIAVEPLFEEFVDFDTFSKSDFRAVKVKACEAVKKSKKLLNFTLDDGTGTDRTILSGIHEYYEPEDLVGKTLLAITNLPPRKMMGIPSCGMLISAIREEEGEERLNLIQLDASIPAGAKMY